MADVCDLDVCDLENKEVAEIIVNTIIHLKSVKRTKATAEKIFNCMKKADENLDFSIFKFNLENLVKHDYLLRKMS